MSSGELEVPVSPRDHVAGSLDAPIVLVEYGDFECPHCGRAFPILKQVQQHFGPRLAFVYRHFPLAETHPHARHAAEASEAADTQRQFWAMHDTLFRHQDALEDEDLIGYARALELDVEQFADELERHVHEKRVRDDFRHGVRSGVNGTPTFFVNGQRFDGEWEDPAAFIASLEAAERSSRPAPPAATSRRR